MKKFLSVVFIFIMSFSLFAGPIDSQWRGENRDGIYTGEKLLKSWPASGPKMIWKVESLDEGYSSPAVTDDHIFITGTTNDHGFLYAFDHTGKQLWKKDLGRAWDGHFPGVRATPTVVEDRLYIMTAHGNVQCYDLAGKLIWSVDVKKKYDAIDIRWGLVESLLVDGDKVFATPGGPSVAVVALNRHTGQVLWTVKGVGEASAYCSPLLFTHNGKRMITTMTAKSVIGFDADSGKLLWKMPHVTDYDINPNTPIYHNGELFTSSGYGTGSQLFKLNSDGTAINKVWAQPLLDSQFGAAVLVDGHIYGSGQKNRAWHCLDWKTGAVKYSEKVLGNKGNIIFADGLAYVYGEKGDVGLVKLSPTAFEIISSFKVPLGTNQHWAHMVIKNGRLYVRHGNALMVYDIAAK